MTPARILVTGDGGFVGRYLRDALVIRFPDAQTFGFRAARGFGSAIDLLDARAVSGLVEELRPDIVVHLAAQSSVSSATNDTGDLTWRVNATGTLHLALAIARYAPDAKVLFASTAELYGGNFSAKPVSESTPLAPLNAYACSKAAAEASLCDVSSPRTSLIIARPFNHTGAGQRETFALPSFAAQIARIKAGLQEPRIRVGNLDLARDFLDVQDVVSAYLALLDTPEPLASPFFVNIASGTPRVLRALLDEMQSLSGVRFDLSVDDGRLRPVDVPIAYGDATLLRSTTGWDPSVAMSTTLARLLQAAHETVCRQL